MSPPLPTVCKYFCLHHNFTTLGLSNNITCHDCLDPSGIAFKLAYDMTSAPTGLFYTLITLPQQGQPNCPLDSFMFLNHKHDLEAINITSSCLGINLGLFPIHDLKLETHAYIFNECKVQSLCTTMGPTDANIIVWSTFPDNLDQQKLGDFLDLLPVSDSNRTGLVATFSKSHSHLKAVLPNVQISLFGSNFKSAAMINEQELTFAKSTKLFENYRAKLTGRIKQANKWRRIPIEIHGTFSNRPGSIPHLLCQQITQYVDIFYNRTKLEIDNAEAVYNRAVSQFIKANITYNKHRQAKIESDDLVQQMEEENKRANDTQYLITEDLRVANDEIQNLQEKIDNICTIKQCPEVCIPQRVCEECKRNITIPVQGTCIFPCTKAENITVVTGSETVRRWEYVPQQRCNANPSCQVMRCVNTVTCEASFISQPVHYDRYIVETRLINTIANCDKPCSESVATAPVTALCCAEFICNSTEQDVDCLNENQRCVQTRTIIYSNLDDVEKNATKFLQSVDEAKRNATITKLRLSRIKANDAYAEKRFNQSKQAFTNANLTLQIATASLEKLRNRNQLAKLEKAKNLNTCRTTQASSFFKIKSVSFDTTIITESPSQLAVDVVIFMESQNITTNETLYIDFNDVDASLKQGAVTIIEKLILSQNTLFSRRDVSETGPHNNELYFKKKCADIKNIVYYIKELNASIFTVAASTISSVFSLKSNVLKLSQLINHSSSILNEELTIDYQQITDLTNKTLEFTNVKESGEIDELVKFMQEYLLSSQQLEIELGISIYQSWQAKMEDLHNQTKSAAGFPCIGFSGCLQKVVDTLDDLVSDIPLNGILSDFSNAAQSLMDLALLQNYNIVSAVTNAQKIYDIASNPVITDYWCASTPRIIIHPVKYLNATENTTIELSCKAEIDQFTSYQWKKDSIQLVNQKNSTLVLTNVTLSDSGNYTCVVTNQVGSTNSFIATVEILRFPSFLLEPNDVYEYLGNLNGATFQCNATGFPNPGYKWYFQPKGEKEFNEIPNSDQNVLVIVPPLPKDEGSYYCEAFIGNESVQSRIANLTVLQSTVVQIAQTVYLNFSYLSKVGETEMQSSGSGSELTFEEGMRQTNSYITNHFSGSGSGENQIGSGMNRVRNITITPYTKLALERNLLDVLNTLMSFGSTTVENISLSIVNPFNLTFSFTLYSHNINYSEDSFSKIHQLVPQAMVEWTNTWQKLQELLSISAFIITDNEYEYESMPSSLEVDVLQIICPTGKEVSSTNNLICGKLL